MAGACAAVLHRGNVFHVVVVDCWGVFFKWQLVLDFVEIGYLLELLLVRVNLLFEILNSLSHALSNFQVVLHLFHGGT